MRKTNILLIFFLVLFSFSVFAVSPFTPTAEGSGITILHPVLDTFKLGDTVYLHFHAINSTGFILNVSQYSCGLHLYGGDGNDIYTSSSIPTDTLTPNNPYDRLLVLNSTIINDTGLYSYNMWCNSSTQSGDLVSYFYVTKDGKDPYNPNNAYNFIGAIIGVIGLIMLMLMIYSKLDDNEHKILKTFMMLLIIYLTLYIPRLIHYTIQENITLDFMEYYLWFIRFFTIYLAFYFMYSMANYYGKLEGIKQMFKDNFGKK